VVDQLRLEVVTRSQKVLEEDVEEVRLPGFLGELGVLPGHTALLTALGSGPLAYRQGGRDHYLAIQSGFAEILDDRVTVLAEVAETPKAIDVDAARNALAEAEQALKGATAEELDELTDALRLAETRIDVATRH
jgi:F-type H+-transporting ATPase subunit epsilon